MTQLCKQCSIEVFDTDRRDFATDIPQHIVLCDGCGITVVNSSGTCTASHCVKHHGLHAQEKAS